jgi:hypothetical protein
VFAGFWNGTGVGSTFEGGMIAMDAGVGVGVGAPSVSLEGLIGWSCWARAAGASTVAAVTVVARVVMTTLWKMWFMLASMRRDRSARVTRDQRTAHALARTAPANQSATNVMHS